MNYNIPTAIQDIDNIIRNLDHPDPAVRCDAAKGAQYAVLGSLPLEKSNELLEAIGRRLTIKVNGHVLLTQPDEYVRERCANALECAASAGKDIRPYLDLLRWSKDNDPHHWVRDMARDAVRYHEGHSRELPMPARFTTRPPARPSEEKAGRVIPNI